MNAFPNLEDLQTRNLNHSFFAVGGDCCAGQQTADVRFCKKKTHRSLRLNRSRALAAVRVVQSNSFEVLSRVQSPTERKYPTKDERLSPMWSLRNLSRNTAHRYLQAKEFLPAQSAHPSFAFQGGKFASTIGRRCARCASISQGFVIIIFIRSIWVYKPPPP